APEALHRLRGFNSPSRRWCSRGARRVVRRVMTGPPSPPIGHNHEPRNSPTHGVGLAPPLLAVVRHAEGTSTHTGVMLACPFPPTIRTDSGAPRGGFLRRDLFDGLRVECR